MYKCEFCGTEYSNLSDYAKCVAACSKRHEEDQYRAKQEQLKAERKKRYTELMDAEKHFNELWKNYVHDYGADSFDLFNKIFGGF